MTAEKCLPLTENLTLETSVNYLLCASASSISGFPTGLKFKITCKILFKILKKHVFPTKPYQKFELEAMKIILCNGSV